MESSVEGAGGGTRSLYCLNIHTIVGSYIIILCYRVVFL
jgi:hypothetical protein